MNGKTTVAMLFGMALSAMTVGVAADDIAPLSDEFDAAGSVADWQRVGVTEGWGIDQAEVFDVDTTEAGRLTLIPYTSSWYQEYRGLLGYKEITGDFVVTTEVRATGRDGVSAPQSNFSLGGIMIRSPRAISEPSDWSPGGENYIFLSLGRADSPGFQFEVKTTQNSNSQLNITAAPPDGVSRIQVVRIGDVFLTLRRAVDGEWWVHQRYYRPDMPDTVQVGMVAYTDWGKVNDFAPVVHNANVLNEDLPDEIDPTPGQGYNPDLIASYDYVRFRRPALPVGLMGANFLNAGEVPDALVITEFGDTYDVPYIPEAEVCPLGDATGDGGLTISDVQCIILGALATGDALPSCMDGDGFESDLNCDASFDVSDVVLTINRVLGIELPADVDADGDACVDSCQ